MPARNLYHDSVVHALEADGWTITDDPLQVSFGGRDLYVDLGAERNTLAAEKGGQKIAVEVQSFLGHSEVRDLEEAVGQFVIYRTLLAQTEPDRKLFLAVPSRVHEGILLERFGQAVIAGVQLRVMVFDEEQAKVIAWIE